MPRRVCSQPSCPTLVDAGARGGRCTTHARSADRARGSREARGYGAAHQRERTAWQEAIDRGDLVTCWRCGEPITKGEPMDLGHDDHDRTITRGPEHAHRCNRSAAGRASHPPRL